MEMTEKPIRVGIATYEQQKQRMMAVARGELKLAPNEPKIWFSSIESLAQLLNSKNQRLLEIIEESQPDSVHDLARLSQRKPSNLSRTLKSLAHMGIVDMVKNGNKLMPRVRYNRFQVDFGPQQVSPL
ncbi:MAG: MarR family transcriptional regulator [Magnetococcales bacterium]|nr:MarR family transcriptional regulator [Magnetococcales bacterium]